MDWHTQSPKEVLKKLQTSENGLTESEVQKRFAKFGKNTLRKHKTKSKLSIFLEQFNSLLVWILIVAAVVSVAIEYFIDAVVIIAIVILNAIIGFIQEYKAEEIIDKLRKSLRYKVKVQREGVRKEIDSKFLVPGDIVLLEEGEKVLADCRLLTSENLQVNEAILSGESFPVDKIIDKLGKDVVLANRKNMIYAGTTIVRGKAAAVVVETGNKTEFGKLAELVQKTEAEITPLEKRINIFSKNISLAILVLVAFVFIIGVSADGINILEMFLVSVSLAIGAIPEGLPAIIAITLAVAIKQMYKVNTLIRRLPAAETLGRATVICTDKTGTLTEESLTVDEIYSGVKYNVDKLKKINSDIKNILKIGVLCNNARDEKDSILGEPTEVALIKAAKKFNINKKILTEANTRVKEFPFDSVRKMMSIIREDGKIKTSYVKGAPLFVLNKCTKELINGKVKLLTPERKKEIAKSLIKMEGSGLRVLGLGFRQLTNISQEDAENHLTFSGFVGMIDPPRKEVSEAIKEAITAGIKIKVITGDSALTTKAVAAKIGLIGEAIEGKELDKLNDSDWHKVVKSKTIFARITPQQKLKIVEILKKQNETVAVTGDGVNDILALKRADVGVSMGVRGSDVARDSSDVVLLDDNFASIILAIRQGRRVFDNLKKSIKFLLAANAGEVFIVIVGLLFKLPLIFLPLAILWMNLVTDSLPALALAIEPADINTMKRAPRSDGLLSGIWQAILMAGVLMVVSSIWVFNYGLSNFGIETARTMAISTAIFFELFFAFSCKSNRSLFLTGILDNKYLIYAFLISAGLHLLAVYSSLGSVFGFVNLTGEQLGLTILYGLSGLIVFEGLKIWQHLLSGRR
ncbi:MAG: HAD-IC family P-type ATPase [Candidatus Peregrinibacteria bacterium]|nr:HAD-IC family P-type ATPase [Candidatus Peregrinibacteria bacterium]